MPKPCAGPAARKLGGWSPGEEISARLGEESEVVPAIGVPARDTPNCHLWRFTEAEPIDR
jgi:hypothetical protein